jgi:hypothetical protein
MNVPNGLQGILWSTDIKKLDLQKDKSYIIHRVLTYGDLEQINWLKEVYSKDEIKDIFINKPQKLYTKSSFNFIKNYVLGIDQKLERDHYDKNLHRNTR